MMVSIVISSTNPCHLHQHHGADHHHEDDDQDDDDQDDDDDNDGDCGGMCPACRTREKETREDTGGGILAAAATKHYTALHCTAL